MNCGKLNFLFKTTLICLGLSPILSFGQAPSDTSFIMSEGTGIMDTVVYEKDSLDIPPHAIYVHIEQGQMSPYKKKYATSLTSLIEAAPDDVSSFWKDKFKNEYAIRLKQRNRVDFPQPDGPIKAVTLPCSTPRSMLHNAGVVP